MTGDLWQIRCGEAAPVMTIQKNPVLPTRRCETNAKKPLFSFSQINSQNWQHCLLFRICNLHKMVMGKRTSEKLWCVKILSGEAYLFKGGKRVQNFLSIIEADEIDIETAAKGSASTSFPTATKRIKVRYELVIYLGNLDTVIILQSVL